MPRVTQLGLVTGVGAVGIAALVTALLITPVTATEPQDPSPVTAPEPAADRTSWPDQGPSSQSRTPPETPTPETPPAETPGQPARDADDGIDAFTPGLYDVDPQIKQAAAQFVERAGTWQPSDARDPAVRLAAAGYPADLVGTVQQLLDPTAQEARTELIYPQYGGLTERSASVMVLARQELRADANLGVREVLIDVRLERAADGAWRVTSRVDPARPSIPPQRAGGPTRVGRAVLDDPAVRLPEPARADVGERRVDDPILSVIAQLARSYRLDVQVLVSGHPGTVFPTSRLSNHIVGRGVDVRTVNGRPVSDIPRDDPLLAEFMIDAGRAGATEVGGPIRLDGSGFFTDAVHQDHFHLGITPTKPPAAPRTTTPSR